MLRITTGTAKNKHITTPDIEGYRGVQEVAKSAVFSIIGTKIVESECLDLYAGSGNMGLESLSRGAKNCDFVDEEPSAVMTIEQNLFICGFLDNYSLFRKDSIKFVHTTESSYDFIFCDPFYKDTSHTHLLKGLGRIIKADGQIFFFHDKSLDLEAQTKGSGLFISSQRRFGQSSFSVLNK